MIPTLLTATIVFVIAFIAVPPVHLFFIAALGSTSGTSCAKTALVLDFYPIWGAASFRSGWFRTKSSIWGSICFTDNIAQLQLKLSDSKGAVARALARSFNHNAGLATPSLALLPR